MAETLKSQRLFAKGFLSLTIIIIIIIFFFLQLFHKRLSWESNCFLVVIKWLPIVSRANKKDCTHSSYILWGSKTLVRRLENNQTLLKYTLVWHRLKSFECSSKLHKVCQDPKELRLLRDNVLLQCNILRRLRVQESWALVLVQLLNHWLGGIFSSNFWLTVGTCNPRTTFSRNLFDDTLVSKRTYVRTDSQVTHEHTVNTATVEAGFVGFNLFSILVVF